MSNNEIMTIQEGAFSYDFQPATIEIKNYDDLVKVSEEIAKHYDSLVFKNSTLPEINEAHRELNSFINGLNESRLNVKREYNEPLKVFEDKIKVLTDTLNKPLQDIKVARDEILDAQEEARHEALSYYLNEQLEDSKVTVDDIEIGSSWTNKGNWTDKLSPRKKLRDEIEFQINKVKETFRQRETNRKILIAFLDDKEMEHEGWVAQLEYREPHEIIEDIQRAEERRLEKEEQAKLAAEKEQQEEVEQLDREVVEEVEKGDVAESFKKTIDGIAKTFQDAKDKQSQPELFTEQIEVTGTAEQLDQLAQYMRENGISVQPIKNNFPF